MVDQVSVVALCCIFRDLLANSPCPLLSALEIQKIIIPLTPNDTYRSRTAPLTSKRCILYIYSTNISTEYFEHVIYSPLFPLQMQFVS